GAGGARARHRGADREPPVGSSGIRDRADRPLLRADRHHQGDLGGTLRRLPRPGSGCRVLRRSARARGDGMSGRPAAPDTERSVAPEPEFAVLGARTVRHAATPTLLLDVQVSEPGGHEVYMIALTIQVMIEPARRTYD